VPPIASLVVLSVVFEVAKDPNAPPVQYPDGFDYNQLRSINYKFPTQFLRYETVGTTSDEHHAGEGSMQQVCSMQQ